MVQRVWVRHVHIVIFKMDNQDFPGGPVVKNLPASAGDMGLIPGMGRFHMLQSSSAYKPQLLKPAHSLKSLCSATSEKPTHHNYSVTPAATDTQCSQKYMNEK